MIRFDAAVLEARPEGAFAVRRPVRLQDVDAAGIVFFPKILEYFNDALFDFLADRGLAADAAIRDRAWGLPLRHVEADFRSPLRFGDLVEVALVKAAMEASRVTIGYRVVRERDRVVAAVGQSVHVFVDLRTFERSELPDELRAAFVDLAG